ncbi:MAG: pyridoxamine 5'-phosphate oxidase [Acidobacteriota bacterium]
MPASETGDTAKIDVSDIRRQYQASTLRRTELDGDPMLQFGAWLDEALKTDNREPTAMSLATCDADGRPSVRTVLLKGFDARGFRFFTNYESRKGRELDGRPAAALLFFWPELERQVRIEGDVERISRGESAEYFHSRPHRSQLSAWCSPQSQPVADRNELEALQREAENRFAGEQVELPEEWGGYRLWPQMIEFWQGRRDRLHDRFRYRRHGDDWAIDRLAP